VAGGEQTLRELVDEYKAKGPVYRRTVQTTLKASYSNYYRRDLIELLEFLTPLFWTPVAPYSEIKLGMGQRLTLGLPTPPGQGPTGGWGADSDAADAAGGNWRSSARGDEL